MNLFVAGLSWRTAPVALREQVAVTANRLCCQGCRLKIAGALDEVVLLSTCNRVEIYGAAARLNGHFNPLLRALSARDLSDHLYLREGADALAHLFSVTAGLDSMVLGETEIIGQVKDAYERARASGLTRGVLNRAFQTAFRTAKELRSRTEVGRGTTSVGSVAVELAGRIFGRALSEKTVFIVGAGQMGEVCARHLAKNGAQTILVANRSFERAQSLAATFGGGAVRFDDLAAAMARADIVIASTGCPDRLFGRGEVEALMRSRRQRPLVLIDIAVPRNIKPEANRLENVYLYDLDDLQAIVHHNRHQREAELASCQQLINRAVTALWTRLAPRPEDCGAALQAEAGCLLLGAPVAAGI